jgi:hypothetical protein
MYYAMPIPIRKNLYTILSQAEISGKDAAKFVALEQALGTNDQQYINLSEDYAKWALDVINGVTIQGRHAAALLQCVLALSKPMQTIPTQKPDTGANPPIISPTPPAAPNNAS